MYAVGICLVLSVCNLLIPLLASWRSTCTNQHCSPYMYGRGPTYSGTIWRGMVEVPLYWLLSEPASTAQCVCLGQRVAGLGSRHHRSEFYIISNRVLDSSFICSIVQAYVWYWLWVTQNCHGRCCSEHYKDYSSRWCTSRRWPGSPADWELMSDEG